MQGSGAGGEVILKGHAPPAFALFKFTKHRRGGYRIFQTGGFRVDPRYKKWGWGGGGGAVRFRRDTKSGGGGGGGSNTHAKL